MDGEHEIPYDRELAKVADSLALRQRYTESLQQQSDAYRVMADQLEEIGDSDGSFEVRIVTDEFTPEQWGFPNQENEVIDWGDGLREGFDEYQKFVEACQAKNARIDKNSDAERTGDE